MSKAHTLAIIQAVKGQPFRVARKGSRYYLRRSTNNGHVQTIVMTRADVIAVCNALIDAIETNAAT